MYIYPLGALILTCQQWTPKCAPNSRNSLALLPCLAPREAPSVVAPPLVTLILPGGWPVPVTGRRRRLLGRRLNLPRVELLLGERVEVLRGDDDHLRGDLGGVKYCAWCVFRYDTELCSIQ